MEEKGRRIEIYIFTIVRDPDESETRVGREICRARPWWTVRDSRLALQPLSLDPSVVNSPCCVYTHVYTYEGLWRVVKSHGGDSPETAKAKFFLARSIFAPAFSIIVYRALFVSHWNFAALYPVPDFWYLSLVLLFPPIRSLKKELFLSRSVCFLNIMELNSNVPVYCKSSPAMASG